LSITPRLKQQLAIETKHKLNAMVADERSTRLDHAKQPLGVEVNRMRIQ
jgi:hypothetical protein